MKKITGNFFLRNTVENKAKKIFVDIYVNEAEEKTAINRWQLSRLLYPHLQISLYTSLSGLSSYLSVSCNPLPDSE